MSNKGFRLYFAGSVTSDFGTWLQNIAQVLLAYRLTHSALTVGLVTGAQFSSPLVLGPWAGVMTDRFGGRRTLLGTQLASAVIAAILAVLEFSGKLDEWWLVAGAVASGLSYTFAMPARNVTVRRLVSADETRPAYDMDSVSYNLGRALAPPLSVILVDTCGFGWAYAVNAVSFLVFSLALALAGVHATEPARRSRVRDGFLVALNESAIMILLLMVAAITVADDPVTVLGPALAVHLHASASWSSAFIAALGGGSVLGSMRRSEYKPSLRLAAGALAALSVCMMLFVLTPWVWGSVAAALGAGVTCLIANSATRTLLAMKAGPERVASVMAVWVVAWAGSKPLASLTDGCLAGLVGVRWTGVLLAMPALVPIAAMTVRRLRGGWPGSLQAPVEVPKQERRG